MTFTGKQLATIGVPPNKIKFFIGREFENEAAVLAELAPKEKTEQKREKTVLEWIWGTFEFLPWVRHGNLPVEMSKSELGRVMDNGGVLINGRKPNSKDILEAGDFPIREFVWFPKNDEKRTSWI